MSRFRDVSIRRKLRLIILLASSSVLLLACASFSVYEVVAHRRSLVNELSTLASVIGNNSTAALTFRDEKSAAQTLSALSTEPGIVAAAVYDANGKLFAEYRAAGATRSPLPARPEDGARFERRGLLLALPVLLDGERIGTVYIHSSLDKLNARLVQYAGLAVLVLGISVLAALFLSARLQRVISDPILQLADVAQKISREKDYSLSVRPQGHDEVGRLFEAFNQMLEQIRERDLALQRANDDLEERVEQRTQDLSREMVQRLHAQKETEERSTQLNALIQTSPLATVVLDAEERVRLCNRAFERLFDYTAEDAIGQLVDDLIVPSELAAEGARFNEQNRTGNTVHVTTRRRRRDGSLVDVEVFGVPLCVDGAITGSFALYQDITARLQAEEQMRKLSLAVEQSPASVVITDIGGKIEYANPKFTAVTGYTLEEVLGKNPRFLKSGTHPREFYEEMWATIVAGRDWQGEIQNRKKNGELYWESAHITPVRNAEGKTTQYLAVREDITARKQTEMQMRRAKEAAEEASRLKSEFLANMSHEIRTPMNGIIGMTELALDSDLDPEQREYLEMVKTSADALLTVINDILDFSKVEAGKLELAPTEFCLRDAIADTMKPLAVRAQQKGLELAYDVAANVPARLHGDPGRLRQILINLTGNSIKFTERGEVVVRVTREECEEATACLHFTVTDTGIGIPADKQKVIFEAFRQVDGSYSRKYEGTGLGLSISTRLVELMGGRIWVESEMGKGSTFHFTAKLGLPAQSAAPPVPELSIPEGLPALVVDDNQTNRRLMEELLRAWKMQPVTVDSGKAALEAMKQKSQAGGAFGLVFIDGRMPDMDGFELARQVRGDAELAGATMVMLTSAGERGDAARCKELGVASYLTKPIQPATLQEAIMTVLGEQAQNGTAQHLVTQHTLRENRPRLRILLAEDNLVNQRLAVRLLEKAGHTVAVAGNGQAALAALDKETFDLVLMDVQMPDMNGFQATAAIREIDKRNGTHIPIVAMTAHAMKEDRERCLAAGMDDYISKPIKPEELHQVIDRQTRKTQESAPPQSTAVPANGNGHGALDLSAALAGVDGDMALLQELIAVFLEQSPTLQATIRQAMRERDTGALSEAAHSLKGSVGYLGVKDVYEAAKSLETSARAGDLAAAEVAYAKLEAGMAWLQPALAAKLPTPAL